MKILKRLFYENQKIKDLVCKGLFIIVFVFLFYSFDVYLRYVTIRIDAFYSVKSFIPNMITIVFICYFLPFILVKSRKVANVWIVIFYIFGCLFFLANYMMLKIKSIPLDFYNIHNAKEGFSFVFVVFKEFDLKLLIFLVCTFILFILLIIMSNRIVITMVKKKKLIFYCVLYCVLILVNVFCINFLECTNDDWQVVTTPRYYFDNFINSKRSAEVMGYYEYFCRDVYLYIKENYTSLYTKAEVEELINESSRFTENNKYTGIFEGKNLIMVMMESIDNLVVTEETMPNLYKMRKDGWNFINRYSALSSGGSTILTEFNSLSGLFYNNAYYRINNNIYSMALPAMFAKSGYVTISAHENNGVYYNRTVLHRNLGFQYSYFLYDMLGSPEYYIDKQFVTNEEIYEKIVPREGEPFFTFLITIAAHGPYDDNYYCNQDADASSSELKCMQFLSRRTDELFGALIERLKEDNILENTVIVAFSDHQAYLYDYTDEDLNLYRKIDNNYAIKNLPFIVYSSDLKHQDFSMLINDIDFVPTMCNLFNIEYDARYFIGTDLFSKQHNDLLMFSDGTWYDGNLYSLSDDVDKTSDYYKEMNERVFDALHFNDMIINTNFYESVD